MAGIGGKLLARENHAGLVASGSGVAADIMDSDFGSSMPAAGRNGSPAVASVRGRSLSEVSEEGTAPNRGGESIIFGWPTYCQAPCITVVPILC